MILFWDTLCGSKNVATSSTIVDMFGGAMCCDACYSVDRARQSLYSVYGSVQWVHDFGFRYGN